LAWFKGSQPRAGEFWSEMEIRRVQAFKERETSGRMVEARRDVGKERRKSPADAIAKNGRYAPV
jgi:hypothetical protein